MSRRYSRRSGGTDVCRFQDETHRPEELNPHRSKVDSNPPTSRHEQANVKTTTCSVLSDLYFQSDFKRRNSRTKLPSKDFVGGVLTQR